mgnify:CR=1 FL=1
MKNKLRIHLLLLAALVITLLAGCAPGYNSSDGLVIGASYKLSSGETLNHDLTVVGGNVTLEQNSTVNGNVAVLGGNVTADGQIKGDLTVMGGAVNLNNHAVIQGTLNAIGGSVYRASGAVVEGQTNNRNSGSNILPTMRAPVPQNNDLASPLRVIFQSLALAALAIVVTLFAPNLMLRAGHTAQFAPAASGGVGCLTLIVLVVMTITIILIPVSLLGFIAAALAILFGWMAIGLLVGRQFAILMKRPWSDPVSAGVGTLFVTLLVGSLNIIPLIGWIVGVLVGLIGLGAVILSRAGTQIYPPTYGSGPTSPRPGPYTPPSTRVYGPESDQPSQTPPPSGTDPTGM